MIKKVINTFKKPRPGFKSIKASSLKVHLLAIRSLHIFSGSIVAPTSTPRVILILKAENGPGPVQRLPITYPILHHLCTKLGYSHHTLVWHAALTLGFLGGLRGAKYTLVPPPNTCKSYFICNEQQRSQLYVSNHSKIKNRTSWFSNRHWLLWYTNLRCMQHACVSLLPCKSLPHTT